MTTAWFFAPPSACTRLPLAMARPWTYFAIGVDPTNEHADVGVVEDGVDRDLVAMHDVEDPVGKPGLGVQPSATRWPRCRALFLVRRARGPGGVERRDLGDRDVPPGAGCRARGPVGRSRRGSTVVRRRPAPSRGLLELGDRARRGARRPEAGGVRGQVDRQRRRRRARSCGAVAVAGAEALRAERLRQRADRREAMVLHQHDDQLDALLHGGDELLGHHQVGAVADHDEHVAVLAASSDRQLDAEPAGDLVAHAREAVLDVVALAVAGAPQLVQVAGHRSRRADHDVRGRG